MLLFYLMILIMPMEESDFWGQSLFGTFTVVKLVGLSCLIVTGCMILANGKTPRFLYSPQAKWYVALCLVQCANFFLQGGAVQSANVAYSHVLSILCLFVIVPTMINNIERLNRSMLVAIAAIGYVSLHAVRQHQLYGGGGFRSSGMFSDSNQYALIANLLIPLAYLWVIAKRPSWERLFVAGCLGVILLGTTFAASRGGLMGSALGLGYLALRSKNAGRNLAIIAATLAPLLLLSPTSPLHRARNPSYGDVQAEQARIITWKAGLRMFQTHPLVGVGIHNFKPLVQSYEEAGEEVVKLAHNTYIELAAETGLPGIVSYIGILFASIYSMEVSRRRALRVRDSHLAMLALGTQTGLISFAVSAFFVTAWWEKIGWLMIFSSMVIHRACAIRLGAYIRRRRLASSVVIEEDFTAPRLAPVPLPPTNATSGNGWPLALRPPAGQSPAGPLGAPLQ